MAQSDSLHDPVRWTRLDAEGRPIRPGNMDQDTFVTQLALMFEGEGGGSGPVCIGQVDR